MHTSHITKSLSVCVIYCLDFIDVCLHCMYAGLRLAGDEIH